MSDLQIVLIVIGGIIIAGVLIFNWWQERKFHQQVDNNFSSFNHETATAEPSLDTDDLALNADKFDDNNFSINDHSFDEDNRQHESESLANFEDVVLEIPTKAEPDAEIELTNLASQHTAAYAEPKSAKHDDIKAIIQDAFKQDAFKVDALKEEAFKKELPNKEAQAIDMAAIPEHETAIAQAPESALPQSLAPSLPDVLHSQVDLVALLYLQGATTVAEVLNALKDGFDGYDKPTFVHVQTDTGWWLLSDIASNAEYTNQAVSKVSCSMQLADREGPVSRGVLNRFQLAVESLGLDINAHVEWQSTSDALSDANALDQFCIDVDKTMGFHLLHGDNGAFTGTKLRGLAEAQGLELAADGAFKYFDPSVKDSAVAAKVLPIPSFVMFNRDHHPFSVDMLRTSVVKSITFQLDIPHVKNCIEAFNHMVQVAKQMETGLNAQLVDDNNRPLGDAQIEKIRHQLKIIQATMLTRGITPGSDCAHRLFS